MLTYAELAEVAGITKSGLKERLKTLDGDLDRVMNYRQKKIQITWRGESLTLGQWSKRTGLSVNAIRTRLDAGWPAERIFTTPCRTWKKQGPDMSVASKKQAWRGLSPEQREIMQEFERIGDTARWE